MFFTRKHVAFFAVALVLAGVAFGGSYLLRHRRLSATSSYFAPLGERRLNEDEQHVVALLKPFIEGKPSDFQLYGNFPRVAWKYSLAFMGYGLANIAAIDKDPANRRQVGLWLDNVIQRMTQTPIWEDWRNDGWGEDPLVPSNVMWKGHLNLLYALHHLVTGEEKYAPAFNKLSNLIAEEMRHTECGGALCEPINYYFQCNTVSMLSLRYHDLFYGTDSTDLQQKWLDWARKNLSVPGEPGKDPGAGLYYAVYHPNSGVVDKRLSGYTNAWALTFLHFFEPERAEKIYWNSFKPTFVRQSLNIAYAAEIPGHGIDGLTSLFAAIAAKEMGDRDLFDRLINLFTLAGWERFQPVNPEMMQVGTVTVDFPQSLPLQGPLLFAKTNIGVTNLFRFAQQESTRR